MAATLAQVVLALAVGLALMVAGLYFTVGVPTEPRFSWLGFLCFCLGAGGGPYVAGCLLGSL